VAQPAPVVGIVLEQHDAAQAIDIGVAKLAANLELEGLHGATPDLHLLEGAQTQAEPGKVPLARHAAILQRG